MVFFWFVVGLVFYELGFSDCILSSVCMYVYLYFLNLLHAGIFEDGNALQNFIFILNVEGSALDF